MRSKALKNELVNDPLARGYAALSDADAAAALNAVNRSVNVYTLTGDDVFGATDAGEFDALTDNARLMWLSFCARQEIDPFAQANLNFVTSIFGAGSITLTALGAIRTKTISRAEELGLGTVEEFDITEVRN